MITSLSSTRGQVVVAAAGIAALTARVWLVSPGAPAWPLVGCYMAVLFPSAAASPRAVGGLISSPVATGLGVAAALLVIALQPPSIGGSISGPVLLLATAAAVSEEALFRGVLFAWLDRRAGPRTAILGAAVAFTVVHIPFYGLAAVPIDLAAGLLFSWQRWVTGSWLPSVATHVFINLGVLL